MKKTAIALAVTLLMAPAAYAQDAEPAAGDTAATTAADDGEERVICKRTSIVGSKFKKKMCGTKADWDRMAQNSKDATREFQTRGRGVEPGN
ncbi:hypothetical protein GRI42_12900 [Erythrobacter gaetbuli]|uniref:Uncharacterized protein n=1 Tax=Qipengyuania gaetbuli TaxID=266952 RepID=A0A844Y1V1_9SPHN|nr:hypothetical protein [Qipengyuania gaetbuli]MXO52205.1 hypothetical protein [Qipengyuania gaetbuli]